MFSEFHVYELWGRKSKLVNGSAPRVKPSQVVVQRANGARDSFACLHCKQCADGGYEIVVKALLSEGQLVCLRAHGHDATYEVAGAQRDVLKVDSYRYRLRPVVRT